MSRKSKTAMMMGPVEPIQMDPGPGNTSAGVIYAANESRFTSAHYQEGLTNYTVGWQDPENLEELIEVVCPAARGTPRRFEFKKGTNKEYFLSEDDDIRAIGSPFKQVKYSGESETSKTLNKGLMTRVDHDEVSDSDDMWRERKAAMLKRRILRNELRRGVAALDAASTNQAKTWDSSADPDQDVTDALALGEKSSGIYPNRVVYGRTAWNARRTSYRGGDVSAKFLEGSKTPEEVAAALGVDLVKVMRALYQSDSTTKTRVVGSLVYAFYAEAVLDKDDPSNIKRFVSPTDQGSEWGVYMVEYPKYTEISVEMYSRIVVTSTLGIRKLTIST